MWAGGQAYSRHAVYLVAALASDIEQRWLAQMGAETTPLSLYGAHL